MRRVLLILSGVALVAIPTYVAVLNRTQAEFFFAPTQSVDIQLGGLVISAFMAGALSIVAIVAVMSTARAIANWRERRQIRRLEQLEAWQRQGGALMWEGNSKQARNLFEKAIRRRPENTSALLALATSYRVTGEDRRALQLLSDAVAKHHGANPDVLIALEEVQGALGERAARLETLERLRALHPRSPRVLKALRDSYVSAARWAEAAAAQETIVAELAGNEKSEREQERLLALRYQATMQIEDPRARATALARLAERRTTPTPVAVSMGDAMVEARDTDEAWSIWERALRAAPRAVIAERLLTLASDPRRQDRLTTLLGKLKPDQAIPDSVRLYAARTHLYAGRIAEAGTELAAIDPSVGTTVLHYALQGEAFQKRGQTEQALLAYSKCADAEPVEYQCRKCGRTTQHWQGYCAGCGAWDSYRSTIELARD